MYGMTSWEMEEMYSSKEEFIKRLQLAIKFDKRSGIDVINYHRNFQGYPEVVEVVFDTGFKRYINVTGNSNQANYRQIGNAVWGGDVVGEFFIEEKEKRA